MAVYEMNIFQTLYFMSLCKNRNTPSIFKHIYTLKPIKKYTARYKNILFKPLCKKNLVKFKIIQVSFYTFLTTSWFDYNKVSLGTASYSKCF